MLIINVIFIVKQIDQKHFTRASLVVQFSIFLILFHNMILLNIEKKFFYKRQRKTIWSEILHIIMINNVILNYLFFIQSAQNLFHTIFFIYLKCKNKVVFLFIYCLSYQRNFFFWQTFEKMTTMSLPS